MIEAYHIACAPGSVGRYCILPGDPGRVPLIAARLENARPVAQNREFTTYTGTLSGVPVSVTSTGIGGPSAAIALEELVSLGAHTFLRVGTCGGIARQVCAGDLVAALSAVRQEGTSREYAPAEYPASGDFSLLRALDDEARSRGLRCHTGVVQSKDSFYGQHSPERMPVAGELLAKWEAWKRLGVLASEMETAALYTAAASLGVRCAAVFNGLWNQERKKAGETEPDHPDMNDAIDVAVGAMRRIIAADA